MKGAYFDCFSGASGDMILAALVDAGATLEAVRKQIARIEIGPVELEAVPVRRAGLRATQILIRGAGAAAPASPQEIRRKIVDAGLEPEIETASLATFDILVAAEAAVHGVDAEEVHLHEIGAVDTIVDVVGAAAAMLDLGVESVHCSAIATGGGSIPSEHGLLPNPGPAVLEILKGRPLRFSDVEAELITPTGAAILEHWSSSFGELPSITPESAGYGAGSRDLPGMPNLLRVLVGEISEESLAVYEDVLVEANIDDMNPEIFSYVAERLFAAGADDVWMTPVIGKQGRPATVLSVLARAPLESVIRDIVLSETSTIGVRAGRVIKSALDRTWVQVEVEGHSIRVKIARRRGAVVNVAPEYADCSEVARATGLPLKEVFRRASSLAGNHTPR